MKQLTLIIDKLLELSKQQNERLADIQRKLELTSASVTSLTKRVESATSGSIQIPSELVTASVALLEKRVERIEDNSTHDATSVTRVARMKVPKELSVVQLYLHTCVRATFNKLQGVVTLVRPVKPSTTGIKIFDRQKFTLISWITLNKGP